MMNAARLLLARRLVVPPTMVTLGGGTVAVAAVAAYQIESDNINNNDNDDDSIKNLRWRTTAASSSSSSLLLFSKMMQVLPVAHAKEAAPTPPPPAAAAATVDLNKVRQALVNLMDDDEEKRGDGTSLRGTMIRLAWHASGTFSKEDNSGGSNGARMRFDPEASWGANAGLHVARQALEPIHQQFPNMSYADLYTYAGVVAIEESGGPTIPFRLGRIDMDSGATSPPDGRLPDADKGSRDKNIQHIRDVFTRMGFTDREMVALLGAHSMGRCHTDRSGYWGPWTFGETTFSNEYFRLLTEERWSPKLVHDGKVWTGPEQYEDSTGKLMMLPSDIALVQDPTLKQYVELYAKDDQVFFQDFAQAFGKLLELGVPSFGGGETTTPPQGRKGFFAWLKGESGRN